MLQRWRFVHTGSHDPATNMALDEALLLLHEAGVSPPTLRVYGWQQPTLSLGYAQRTADEVDLAACQAYGIAVIRRPTGGRAVLHDQEVTYSVIMPIGMSGRASTLSVDYCRIGTALVTALHSLGLPATLERQHRRPTASRSRVSPACFVTLSRYEISVAGKKVIGSAQKRLQRSLLQHGAIPLWLDRQRLLRCLRVPDLPQAMHEVQAAMAAINEIVVPPLTPAAVHDALRAGFGTTFAAEMQELPLSPEEWALAQYLRETKYATGLWNLDGPTAWRAQVAHGDVISRVLSAEERL